MADNIWFKDWNKSKSINDTGDVPFYRPLELTPEQQAQARKNIGVTGSPDITNLENKVDNLEGNVASLSGTVGTISSEFSTLSGNVDNALNSANAAIASIGSFSADLYTVSAKSDTNSGNINTLSAQVGTNTTNISTISGKNQVQDNQISTISGTVNGLVNNVNILSAKEANDRTDIDTISGKVEDISESIEDIDDAVVSAISAADVAISAASSAIDVVTAASAIVSGKQNKLIPGQNISITTGAVIDVKNDGCSATGTNAVALGFRTQANGQYSFAAGLGTSASENGQAVFGKYNNTNDNECNIFQIGNGTNVSNKHNIIGVGDSAVKIDSNKIQIGEDYFGSIILNKNENNCVTINSIYCTANGDNSISMGIETEAYGNYSLAKGNCSTANSDYSIAFGEYNATNSDYSIALGTDSTTETDSFYSIANGQNTKTYGTYSYAGGNNSIASGNYQYVIGQYNNPNEDDLFIIGNGSNGNNRSNIMTVDTSSINVNGNLNVSGTDFAFNNQMIVDSLKTASATICGQYDFVAVPAIPTNGNNYILVHDSLSALPYTKANYLGNTLFSADETFWKSTLTYDGRFKNNFGAPFWYIDSFNIDAPVSATYISMFRANIRLLGINNWGHFNVPRGLWTFRDCGIEHIPSSWKGFSGWSVADNNRMFMGCKLKEIPTDYTDYHLPTNSAYQFSGNFSACTALTGDIVPFMDWVLAEESANNTTYSKSACFAGCTGVPNYNTLTADSKYSAFF